MKRIAFIDLLRGIVILYIVGFWHLMNYSSVYKAYSNQYTLRVIVIVLGLFVFLSGYLLGNKQRYDNAGGLLKFYTKRLLRIYPLYLGALLLWLYLGMAGTSTLMKAAVLVTAFKGPQPPTLWFMTMIIVFYILAPALIRHADDNWKFLAVSAAILGLAAWAYTSAPNFDLRLFIYFPAFAAGIWVTNHPERQSFLLRALLPVCLLASVYLSFTSARPPEISLESIPLVVTGTLSVFVLLRHYSERIRTFRLFEVLSYASYVMYLIHRPVYATMRKLYFPSDGVAQILYLAMVCLPLIIGLSWAIQKLYDRTLSLFIRTDSKKPSTLV